MSACRPGHEPPFPKGSIMKRLAKIAQTLQCAATMAKVVATIGGIVMPLIFPVNLTPIDRPMATHRIILASADRSGLDASQLRLHLG